MGTASNISEYISNQVLQFQLDRLTGKRLSDDIDDVTQENISNLIEAADAYIQQPKMQAAWLEFLRISQVAPPLLHN